MVHMSVTDNGVGIPVEIQERGFEPFFTPRRSAGERVGPEPDFRLRCPVRRAGNLAEHAGQGHDGVPLPAVERPTQ